MQTTKKARWQQATALVSLSTCGAMTGMAFAHASTAELTSPTGMPIKLLALNKPARSAAATDSALRSAIVKSAQYYLRLAQSRSPSEMEALIWQNDSVDGVDHGESCAAFASLMLESGAQAAGLQSWVTGGTTYPWPVHNWVDARVDPNPDSPGVISILQDAQANHRWHPLGDGYTPQPGDWVLFDGHVEVVTKYAGGVLYTIGGDSGSNLSVNAHQYDGPLAAQGVAGFVDNGVLLSAVSQTSGGAPTSTVAADEPAQGALLPAQGQSDQGQAGQGQADIPGMMMPAISLGGAANGAGQSEGSASDGSASGGSASGGSAVGGSAVGGSVSEGSVAGQDALTAKATIPGAMPVTGSVISYSSVSSSPRYSRSPVAPPAAAVADSGTQQAFINQVVPGALAAQRQYGIPAAVTIAQAIDESGWGQSQLATQDNNLFGIKGTGPAGSVTVPTQEYESGQAVTVNAPFRVYSNVGQSINDHSLLLATGSAYQQAMADRRSPDAFANDLTGVYATDPNYGSTLITIMRQYNLYRYDAGTSAASGTTTSQGNATPQSAATAQGAGTKGSGQSAQSGGAGQNVAGQNAASLNGAGQNAAIPGTPVVNVGSLGIGAQQATGQNAGGRGAGSSVGTGGGSVGTGGSRGSGSSRGSAGAGGSGGTRGTNVSGGKQGTNGSGGTGGSNGSIGRGSGSAGTRESGGTGGSAGTGGSGGTRGSVATGGSRRTSGSVATGGSGRTSGSVATGGSGGRGASGQASIPGLDEYAGAAATSYPASAATSAHLQPMGGQALRAGPRNVRVSTRRYVPEMPRIVTTDFITTAKIPLLRAKPLYQDVAAGHGIRWELLAACDWMQCQAQPGVSPVYGENLGTKNPDGTVYRTKGDALEQCAADLVELAAAVYGINLRQRMLLSVRELASVFGAFRWGGLLKTHRVSAMEFPYSVEGLTAQHLKMRWPDIGEDAPDKPGARFRMPFGAVPVVLRLNYPAVA